MKTIMVNIPPVGEHDIAIRFPDGRKWLLQYRNYEGNQKTGEGASVDLCLDSCYDVHNWRGSEMKPSRAIKKQHVRRADQLCIVI
jgi:hypothetical protein